MLRLLVTKSAVLLFAVLFSFCLSGAARTPIKLNPGDTPPPSIGVTIDGEEIVTSKYAGKVLVVTFWASWCGPCKKELPMLEGIQRVAGKGQVQVVAVNTESPEQFRKIAKTLASLTLQLSHDYRKKSAEAYGVNGIPHLVLIGRDGKVINVHRGYSEESIDSILDEINGALAKKDVAGASD